MRVRGSLLLLVALAALLTPSLIHLATRTSAEAAAERYAAHDSTAYTLRPDKLQKAIALNRTRMALEVAGAIWTPAQLLLLLSLGAAARTRDLALRLSPNRWAQNRWAQGSAFLLLLILTTALLDLPLELYGHRVALRYGLSVQGWASWFTDLAKGLVLEWLIGVPLVMLLFRVMRRSPTRWWLWFWVPAVLVAAAGVFLTPYVIDPLFNRFEPLAQSNPALVAQLQRVIARGGLSIPPQRTFLMEASAKSTELNAYVTGFGASKRIVVWDTTIARSSPDEIAFIFAHEMGHYALGHIVTGVAFACAALLPFFWLGYCGTRELLSRFGVAWRIPSQQDWATLVVLLLVLSTISTITAPIQNGFSRLIEHNADVYGQEAVHGIIANPQAVGLQSFQTLGEDSLDDPTPHPLFDFWFATHPPIRLRAAFAEAYDPWAPGRHPKYFAK